MGDFKLFWAAVVCGRATDGVMKKSGCNRALGWGLDWGVMACSKAALDWSNWEKKGLHFIVFSLIFCLSQISFSLCLISVSDFPKKVK